VRTEQQSETEQQSRVGGWVSAGAVKVVQTRLWLALCLASGVWGCVATWGWGAVVDTCRTLVVLRMWVVIVCLAVLLVRGHA
jgi:hypothetical protein